MNTSATVEAPHQKRSKRIFQAGISAILCKGVVLGANAVAIPIVVRFLGPIQFGIWMTVSTTLALLIVLDLGISSALTNRISEAYAKDDKDLAGVYATTGIMLIGLIAAALGLLAWLFWGAVNWGHLFGLDGPENNRVISHAVAAAYFVFLVGLPASLAAKFLGGYQEVKVSNVVAAIGAGLNLVSVAVIAHLHGSLVMLIIGSSGATVGTNLGCLIWLWIWHKPWLRPSYRRWRSNLVRPLLSSGSGFFILQLAGLIVFNSDNLVISHYLGPQQVTPYSVTWKLVGYTAALQIIITPALWPAYAEAWVRRDLAWMRKTLRKVMMITMSAAFLGNLTLVLWGRKLIGLWAGPSAVPAQTLLVLMCIWILISTFMANTSTILLATNNIRMQAWLSVVAAAANLGGSIWLVQRIGSNGVVLATIGSYLFFLVGPQTWKTVKVLGPGSDPASNTEPAFSQGEGNLKRKVGWYQRISQVLRLPLAGPVFRWYAPRRRWPANTKPSRSPRILIANLMPSLGDTICYMALVETIRDAIPEAEITWLADGAVAKLVAKHPDVDHVLTIQTPPSRLEKIPTVGTYYRVFELIKSIRRLQVNSRFDLAIVPRGGVDPSFSAHAVWMLNLPVSAGYSHLIEPTDTEHAFPDSLLTHKETRILSLHESARSIHLLSLTDLVPDARERFDSLQPLCGVIAIAKRLEPATILNKVGLTSKTDFVVLSPFAGHARKEWPPEKFRELARTIVAETNLHVILTGTAMHIPGTEAIREGLGDRVISASGALDLQELMSLLSLATAFVGNDSGAGHVAGALGIPVISLHVQAKGADPYHKGSPEQHTPLGPKVTIVRPDRFLPPCEVRCESSTVHCLAQVTVDEVWSALRKALE